MYSEYVSWAKQIDISDTSDTQWNWVVSFLRWCEYFWYRKESSNVAHFIFRRYIDSSLYRTKQNKIHLYSETVIFMYIYSFHIFNASFSSYKSEYLRTEEREEINKITVRPSCTRWQISPFSLLPQLSHAQN